MVKQTEFTPAQEKAYAWLKTFPDWGHRTLARRLHADDPALFPTVERARSVLRGLTGNNGQESKAAAKKRGTARPAGKPGRLPPLPASADTPWEPFELDTRRNLILSDIHLPHHAKPELELALKYGDQFKPDCVLINGDLFDFYQLSRFDKSPTKPKVSHELECGRQFFAHLRARYPKARIVYKLGNHDERWQKYLWQAAPLLFDIPALVDAWHEPAGIEEYGVEVVDDQRIILAGKLPVLHGHELARGGNPVSPARGAYIRARQSVLIGHYHKTSDFDTRTLMGELVVTRSTGCLCGLHPEYARVNDWTHGFAVQTVASDGEYEVSLKRIAYGKVY